MRTRYFPDDYSDDEFDLWLKHTGAARLESEFDAIRARIGTATERPEDLEVVPLNISFGPETRNSSLFSA